jgi:hypothetical protein
MTVAWEAVVGCVSLLQALELEELVSSLAESEDEEDPTRPLLELLEPVPPAAKEPKSCGSRSKIRMSRSRVMRVGAEEIRCLDGC